MADYTRATGASGTMLIRDTGSVVEFWLIAGSATYNYSLPWGYTANGVVPNYNFRFETGGAWQRLGSITVSDRQNVTFRLGSSGTVGLGGPTDFTVFIERTTPPPAPTIKSATAVSTSQIDVVFVSNGDGGNPVDEWQLAYSLNSSLQDNTVVSDGSTRINGLTSGKTYYFWARGRNDRGWGPWSARVSEFTWRAPDAPTPVTFSNITQTTIRTKFTGGFDGGEPVDEWQLAYGLSSDIAFATVISSNGQNDITNLSPGKSYHFWARGRNAAGWSPWSSVRVGTLRAGALVKHQGVWKRALPYVRVNGVWRLARPRVKHAGVWKETS